jgi:hypothetical protein
LGQNRYRKQTFESEGGVYALNWYNVLGIR